MPRNRAVLAMVTAVVIKVDTLVFIESERHNRDIVTHSERRVIRRVDSSLTSGRLAALCLLTMMPPSLRILQGRLGFLAEVFFSPDR